MPGQLPTMPSLGVNQNPQTPVAPGAVSSVGRFLTQPFTTPTPAPTPTPAAPAPQAAPAAGNNPYAPGGVIPSEATPAAVAAFRASVGAALEGSGVMTNADTRRGLQPAPIDPQANQIRFVDQNTPHYAPAAPNMIRGGVDPGAAAPTVIGAGRTLHAGTLGGLEGGGGMSLPTFDRAAPFLARQQEANLNPETHAKTQLSQIYSKRFADELKAAGDDPMKQQQAVLNHEQNLRYLLYGPVIGGVPIKQTQ